VEARNEADSLAYQMEKLLRDSGDKISDNDRSAIEGKVSELRRVAQADDLGRIRQAIEELKQASYAVSQRMYGQPESGPQAGPAYSGGNGHDQRQPEGEDVVEGEFREV